MALLSNILGNSYKGEQGSQGIQGTQGLQGIQGLLGIQGLQGRQGLQGISGAFAGQGIQGSAGAAPTPNNIIRTEFIVSTPTKSVFYLIYNVGFIDVYLNGSHLSTSEYTASDGNTIVLEFPAVIDDILTVVNFSLGNSIQGSQGISGAFVGQGIQGTQGLQGIQGLLGIQGIQGSQGIQGIQGSTILAIFSWLSVS